MRGKPPAPLCDFTRFYSLVNVRGATGCNADVSVHKRSTTLTCRYTKLCKTRLASSKPFMGIWLQQPQVSLNATHTRTHRSGEVTCSVFSRSSVSVSASCWLLFCRVRFVKPGRLRLLTADSPNIIRHKAQRHFLGGF